MKEYPFYTIKENFIPGFEPEIYMGMCMNDYCYGIAYATGYFANEEGKRYLIVRNLDKWYVENIAKETGYTAYESKHNFERDRKNQWVVKCRNISELPALPDIKNLPDFCRAYIEIHGVIDLANAKDRKGNTLKRLRLRIYGNKEILSFINKVLPAKEKKLQYIKNTVNGKYIGKTYALYFQSATEILKILKWIDGHPKNDIVWKKWKDIV